MGCCLQWNLILWPLQMESTFGLKTNRIQIFLHHLSLFPLLIFCCSHQLGLENRGHAYWDTFVTGDLFLLDTDPRQTELVNPCWCSHTSLCWHRGISLKMGGSAFFGPTFYSACMFVVRKWYLCKTCIISQLKT